MLRIRGVYANVQLEVSSMIENNGPSEAYTAAHMGP